MSESEKEPIVDVAGHGGEDDGDSDGSGRRRNRNRKKGRGKEGNFRKAKEVVLFGFRKVEKQLIRRKNRAANPSSSSSAGCLGMRVGGGRGGLGGCYGCFKQTPTLDSTVEARTSDPNSPEFTNQMLRALIEKNDFYSKECNPHLGSDNPDEN